MTSRVCAQTQLDQHTAQSARVLTKLETRDTHGVEATRVGALRRSKAAFTTTRVVSTSKHRYGGRQSLRHRETHGGERSDTVYDGDGDVSLSESGHYPDPETFDEDDDDLNPSCGHTCPVRSGCKRCYTSSEGTGSPIKMRRCPPKTLRPWYKRGGTV